MIKFGDYFFESTSTKTKGFSNIVLSERLINLLKIVDSEISYKILSLEKSYGSYDISYLDLSDEDNITYLPYAKFSQLDGSDPFENKYRQSTKIGRVANKFLKDVTQKQLEDFVNKYKSKIKEISSEINFKIVEGNDLKYWYYGGRYSEGNGSLQHSCMSADQCQKFLDFFTKNPETVKMLILLNKKGDKILGRSNLWFPTNPDGRVFMDRIYTTLDYETELFINYAKQNDYIYKSKQIYGGSVVPVIDRGEKKKIVMIAQMKPIKYDYYPYVDTFQFYNPITGEITSDSTKYEDEGFVSLIDFRGGYIKNNDKYKIDYLGRLVLVDYLRFSKSSIK